VREYPEEILGKKVAARFSGILPFLFKVLAAAKPLSIQVHPNKEQAESGFARENQRGIPLHADHRNYKDDNHKPEIMCALTEFWALKGFRPIQEMVRLLDNLEIRSLEQEVQILRRQPNRDGLQRFLRQAMTMDKERRRRVVEEVATSARRTQDDASALCKWMTRLEQEYPGDIGVLSPALLNLVKLEPGEAMYLPAGELHAYLHGVGIELMANSDNVLRGGLTPKHIDVAELLNILNFAHGEVDVLRPIECTPGEALYPTAASEFVLSVIDVSSGTPYESQRDRSVEIMICTLGEATISEVPDGAVTTLAQGVSILVPAAVEKYVIEGRAKIYKAAVPLV
jgi:mannose-6-phosphate isomerase